MRTDQYSVQGFSFSEVSEGKDGMSHAEELMALKKWVANHKGERITATLASSIPACLGYYPVVTADGTVTGEIADADDPAYSIYFAPWQRGHLRCEEFWCVVRD